jgi:hypothetical protein
MKTKTFFKVIVLCMFITSSGGFFYGCQQQEMERLKSENESLKTKVKSLEEEIVKLKETDQNYFNKGVDAFNRAHSQTDYQSAADIFKQLIQKFPNSPYVTQSQHYISEITQKTSDMEKINAETTNFETAINNHNFGAASIALEKLKPLISQEEYNELNKRLYDEKNKPIETTINELVADFGDEGTGPNRLFGKVVKFPANFGYIDRGRRELTAYSEGCAKGSSISVFYNGTNMEDYFTRHDPDCKTRYMVTGKTMIYRNAFILYVQAKSIEEMEP